MYSDAPVLAGGIQDAVNKAALDASDSRTAFRVYGVHCSGLGVYIRHVRTLYRPLSREDGIITQYYDLEFLTSMQASQTL